MVAQATESDTMAAYGEFVAELNRAAMSVAEVTYVMHKSEWIDGMWVDTPTSFVKYRAPMSLYLRIGESGSPEQELLYQEGWNDNRIRVAVGRWLPNLNLSPSSSLAMRKNRHSIQFLSPKVVVQRIMDDVNRGRGREDIHVTDLGMSVELGESVRCFRVQMPKQLVPEFYADQVELCQSSRTKLLVTLKAWEQHEGQIRLVESYGYESLQVNPGLTDSDFSPLNSDYSF